MHAISGDEGTESICDAADWEWEKKTSAKEELLKHNGPFQIPPCWFSFNRLNDVSLFQTNSLNIGRLRCFHHFSILRRSLITKTWMC